MKGYISLEWQFEHVFLWDLLHANQNSCNMKDMLLHSLCIYLCQYKVATVKAAIYFKTVLYIFFGLNCYSLKGAVTAWHQWSPCMETATLFISSHCHLLCCLWAELLRLCVGWLLFFPPLDRKVGPLHVFYPTFLQDTNISAFNWLQFYRRVCPRCGCSKMKEHQCWAWMFPIQLPIAPSFYFESFFFTWVWGFQMILVILDFFPCFYRWPVTVSPSVMERCRMLVLACIPGTVDTVSFTGKIYVSFFSFFPR